MGVIHQSSARIYSKNKTEGRRPLANIRRNVHSKFPIEELQYQIRKKTSSRCFVTKEAAAFTAAVLEYLCAEILEQAGSHSQSSPGIIKASDLTHAFSQDRELHQVLDNLLLRPTTAGRKTNAVERDLCDDFQRLVKIRRYPLLPLSFLYTNILHTSSFTSGRLVGVEMTPISGGGKGKGGKYYLAQMSLIEGCGPRWTASRKAGITFPVTRIKKRMILFLGHGIRYVRKTAAVYITAVLEYLATELLEVAGNAAHRHKKKRITPKHILLGVREDPEFKELLRGVTIAYGGVDPYDEPGVKKN